MEIFIELTLIVFIATFFAIAMRLLKQPLIVGYILAGILTGPYFLNILQAKEQIELFSKIGITVLLFIVGLSLSPKVIKEVGKVSLITGVGQVIFTSLIGFTIALLLGIDKIAALYVSVALTFSSTIIILKLLADKGDLNKLYGKISIGFLLIQDIIATIILLFVSSFTNKADLNLFNTIFLLLLKSVTILCALYLISMYIIPRISKFAASSQELLFLFSLSWGLGLASLFYVLGFSIEIGALIAGVTLSMTPFAYEIAARLKPLRDFFIVLFFILLGSQLALPNVESIIIPALILSVFVLIGNPIIVIILINLLGYKRRTGFMAGLTVAQISEFSLILATLGFSLGHIPKEILSLITIVGLITIAGSTYFILYSDKIYPYAENMLKLLELRRQNRKQSTGTEKNYDIILFGFDRVGQIFVNTFNKIQRSFVVVDFNPVSINRLQKTNIPHRFGDAEDLEFLQELNLHKTKLIVSTIPDVKTNILLVKKAKNTNTKTVVIVISHDTKQAKELYTQGATYVIMPHYLGARYASNLITRLGIDIKAFQEEQEKHLDYINKLINYV